MKLYVRYIHDESTPKELLRIRSSDKYFKIILEPNFYEIYYNPEQIYILNDCDLLVVVPEKPIHLLSKEEIVEFAEKVLDVLARIDIPRILKGEKPIVFTGNEFVIEV